MTLEDLKAFCRHKKRKTLAAIAIRDALTVSDGPNFEAVSAILEHACGS